MNTPSSLDCPETGAWRAWLDHEDAAPDSLEQHLAGCPACEDQVAHLRDAAAHANAALSRLAPRALPSAAEVAMARERLRAAQSRRSVPRRLPAQEPPIPMFLARLSTPWRFAAGGVAAAVTVSLLVAFTPEGSAVAASFLAQFRSQHVAAIELSPQSQSDIIRTLNALGNLGTVNMPGGAGADRARAAAQDTLDQGKSVSLAEASQSLGFALQTPDPETLPSGLDTAPQVRVTPSSQVRFTFDKSKAGAYLQSIGHAEVNLPDRFDGATLVVSIPSAAILQYGNSSSRDALIIGEAGELVVDVEGGKVSLPEMRDFLLGMPDLPQSTVGQLRQMRNWNNTLPVPVPVDKVNWQSTTFKGHQGLLLNDNSGVGSAAIWNANGHLYGVAGSLRATELKRIADSMAVTH